MTQIHTSPTAPLSATTFVPDNVAELVAHVGDVPGERIMLQPAPGTATEADLIRLCENDKRLCELIDGTLVEKGMGTFESYLGYVLGTSLAAFVAEHDLGILIGPDGMLRFSPKRVYLPDVSFISWSQNPMRELHKQQVADLHPDLAVEVLSPSNTPREMENKRRDYFAWGTRLVWELDPYKRIMHVYSSPDEFTVVDETGALDGGDVLPGFSLPLAKLFKDADRTP